MPGLGFTGGIYDRTQRWDYVFLFVAGSILMSSAIMMIITIVYYKGCRSRSSSDDKVTGSDTCDVYIIESSYGETVVDSDTSSFGSNSSSCKETASYDEVIEYKTKNSSL